MSFDQADYFCGRCHELPEQCQCLDWDDDDDDNNPVDLDFDYCFECGQSSGGDMICTACNEVWDLWHPLTPGVDDLYETEIPF